MPTPTESKRNATPRDEVFVQLAEFLRQRNTPARKMLPFLDRPVVLTVAGSIFIALIANWWQSSRERHLLQVQHERQLTEQKLNLMRSVSTVYQEEHSTLNSWLVFVLRRAKERAKPQTTRSVDKIEEWNEQLRKLEAGLRNLEPSDGILGQIAVLFESKDVRANVEELRANSKSLEDLCNDTIRDYSAEEKLGEEQRIEAESTRIEITKESDGLLYELIKNMARELSMLPDR